MCGSRPEVNAVPGRDEDSTWYVVHMMNSLYSIQLCFCSMHLILVSCDLPKYGHIPSLLNDFNLVIYITYFAIEM